MRVSMFNISKYLKVSILLVFLQLISNQVFASELEEKYSQKNTLFVDVYKDSNCGCCKRWVDSLNEQHIQTKVHDLENVINLKKSLELQQKFYSCHTSMSQEGYIFEGHIPARYIKQFLQDKPKNVLGLSVPGMPVGSPGMEYQDKFMSYNILLLNKDGSTSVYAVISSASDQT